jgi:hypothetical protein
MTRGDRENLQLPQRQRADEIHGDINARKNAAARDAPFARGGEAGPSGTGKQRKKAE